MTLWEFIVCTMHYLYVTVLLSGLREKCLSLGLDVAADSAHMTACLVASEDVFVGISAIDTIVIPPNNHRAAENTNNIVRAKNFTSKK